MQVVLAMLRKAAPFRDDPDLIERAWKEYCEVMSYRATAEYRLAYAERLLSLVVDAAHRGLKGIGLVAAADNLNSSIMRLLNQAWTTFWKDPTGYQLWEAEQVRDLKKSLGASA